MKEKKKKETKKRKKEKIYICKETTAIGDNVYLDGATGHVFYWNQRKW